LWQANIANFAAFLSKLFELMESKEFNFKSLVDLIIERWMLLAVVGIVGAMVGVVISMPTFMPAKFNSVAVVYPVNVLAYSEESETEQLLQVFESSSIRDSIVDKFNLYDRYKIERGQPESRYYLIEEFNQRFFISKTLYESVRIEVLDEAPEVARAMASEMLTQVNRKFNELANERGRNLTNSFKIQMDYQSSVIDSLEQLASKMSVEKGLLEYEAQSRELMRGYIDATASGNSTMKEEIERFMENSQESGSSLMMLQSLTEFSIERRSEMEKGYLFWREFAFRDVNYIDVIVEPEVADKKAWPVRWLVVALSMGAALLAAVVLLALGKSGSRS
jgi:hypothetical protein